ncbi:MAG: hypothetical protein AAF639_21135 [Chloroflexota bacterium]
MTTQTVAVQLPESLHQRLQHMAAITRRSLDSLVIQTLDYNVPKLPSYLPQKAQDELNALEKLDDDTLWGVAESQYDTDKQKAYRSLLQKNAQGALTSQERAEMDMHLEAVDLLTLWKSYAYVLGDFPK